MSNIFTIGEALIDFIPEQKGVSLKDVASFQKAAGGAPANVAATVAILGGQSYFIGKLGQDAFGDFLVEVLKNVGVGVNYIQRTDKANTALAFVSLREDGERDFSFYRSPSADMLLEEKEINNNWFNEGDILHFCSVSLVDAPVRKAHFAAIKAVKEVGGIISFDPNIRLPLWKDHNEYKNVIRDFLKFANILKISEDEIEFITGVKDEKIAIQWLLSLEIKILLITRGRNGVSAYYKNHEMKVPGCSVSVSDTTGAGDAFIGSFLYKISINNVDINHISIEDMKQILGFSNAVAALTTTKKGAIGAIPTRQVVEKFINVSDVEKYRPSYHFTPQKDWMNDPNGMVYFDGEYHLCYQHDNYDKVFSDMSWGHAISTDLINWIEYPKAIVPDNDGLGMIFSGSTVVDKNNCAGFGVDTLVSFYTSTKPRQQQSMAYSIDKGKVWIKYNGNPIIKNEEEDSIPDDFRDPKVIWHKDSQKWIMSLAVKDHIEFWSSYNLKGWTKESEFGQEIGAHGGVWECPDLIELPVDANENDKKWVLLVSINPGGPNGGSATQYFVGDFKELNGKMTYISNQKEEKWIDYGTDNYAGVTWSNIENKAIVIGWMSNWSYADKVPTSNWRGAMTIPRELELKNIQGQILVTSKPIEALEKIIGRSIATIDDVKLNSNINVGKELAASRIKVEMDIIEMEDMGIEIGNCEGQNVRIGYNMKKGYLYVDRSNSGEKSFESGFGKLHKAKVVSKMEKLQIEIFMDKSSVEVFFNNGEYVMTEIIFPKEVFTMVKVFSDNKTEIRKFDIKKMIC